MDINIRLDKSVVTVVKDKQDIINEQYYWDSKSVQERIMAVEFLRQQYIEMNNLPNAIDKTVVVIHKGKE